MRLSTILILVAPLGLSGCGASSDVSDDCLRYLDCMAIEFPDDVDLYASTYGEDADCWSAGSSEALSCTQECQAGLEAASIDDPSQAACWPSDLPEARYLFAAYPVWAYTCTTDLCYDLTATFAASSPGQAFSMSLLWRSDFSLGTQCTIDHDLSFECNPASSTEHDYDFVGSFNAAFSESTLDEKRDGISNCSYEGVPGGA